MYFLQSDQFGSNVEMEQSRPINKFPIQCVLNVHVTVMGLVLSKKRELTNLKGFLAYGIVQPLILHVSNLFFILSLMFGNKSAPLTCLHHP